MATTPKLRVFIMGVGSATGFALARALTQVCPHGSCIFADEASTTSASRRLSELASLGQTLELAWTSKALGEGLLSEAEWVLLVPDLHMDPPEILQGVTAFALRALRLNRPVLLWSDSLVYGWPPLLPKEEFALQPPTLGLAALAACEQAVLSFAMLHQVPAWVIRPPWLYGDGDLDALLPLKGTPAHEPVLVECLHVEDAARYLERFLSVAAPSGTYNLGPGERLTDVALASMVGARRLPPEMVRVLPTCCLRAVDSSRFQDRTDPLPPRRHSLESYFAARPAAFAS